MLEIIDRINPDQIRSLFAFFYTTLDRAKVMSQFVCHDNKLLLALDGTGYFESPDLRCDAC
jgi:hypothetical protein